jgi:hypothetical protein
MGCWDDGIAYVIVHILLLLNQASIYENTLLAQQIMKAKFLFFVNDEKYLKTDFDIPG